jgi:hypothetical protein
MPVLSYLCGEKGRRELFVFRLLPFEWAGKRIWRCQTAAHDKPPDEAVCPSERQVMIMVESRRLALSSLLGEDRRPCRLP